MPLISKSKYLSGIKCHKLIWHEYNAKHLIPATSESTQAIFDQGHIIGNLARSMYPDGINLEGEVFDIQQSVIDTQEALSFRQPLFEAAFIFDNAYACVDILLPAGEDEWDIIEVKSSSSVKDVHRHDLAIQKYILEGCGLRIRKCILMHVNTDFVKVGVIQPQEYFIQSDETEVIPAFMNDLSQQLRTLNSVIENPTTPEVAIGTHCSKPYACAMFSVCHSHLPKDNVLNLFYGGKKSRVLLNDGILEITDIPEDFRLTENQLIQKEVIQSGKPYVNREAIRNFLAQIEAPYYFLDFETVNPALPLWDGTSPFEQIPFQFSIFKMETADSEPVHVPFLAEGRDDPRPELMRMLKEHLGESGSIIAYNAAFERSRIRECAEALPEYREWSEMISSRIVDLMEPFRSFWYYHPDQHGSYSMKDVLPVMGGASYSGLNIRDGGMATRAFHRMTFGDVPEEDMLQTRKDLIEYCGQDTGGMIDVWKGLRRLVEGEDELMS